MCANFQTKRNTLTFLTKICPKMNFRVEIQKTNVGIKISILEILYVPTFRQNGQLWLFGLKFAQKWILGSDFQRIDVGIRISTLEIPCEPIFRQNGQLWLFGPKFAQKWFWGRKFKNLSLDLESAPPRYHLSHFSVKIDNFEFFGLYLGNLPNYVQ